jgi:hypothetical protein
MQQNSRNSMPSSKWPGRDARESSPLRLQSENETGVRCSCFTRSLLLHVCSVLLAWWEEHQDNPYPTEEDKLEIMESSGLDATQVLYANVCAYRLCLL